MDELKRMLVEADRGRPAPGVRGDVVEAVRRRGRRRRAARVGVGVIALVVVGVGVWRGVGMVATEVATPAKEVARVDQREDVDHAEREAGFHALVAERMLAAEARVRAEERVRRVMARPGALAVVQEQRERAATAAVREGNRYYRQAQLEQAAAEYRQAITLFPETGAAVVARQRLGQIDSGKEG